MREKQAKITQWLLNNRIQMEYIVIGSFLCTKYIRLPKTNIRNTAKSLHFPRELYCNFFYLKRLFSSFLLLNSLAYSTWMHQTRCNSALPIISVLFTTPNFVTYWRTLYTRKTRTAWKATFSLEGVKNKECKITRIKI